MIKRFPEAPPSDVWAHLVSFMGRLHEVDKFLILMMSSCRTSGLSDVQIQLGRLRPNLTQSGVKLPGSGTGNFQFPNSIL